MERYQEGMLARSKAGHDTGKLYIIVKIDEEYVYLTDGHLKTLDHPKRKKRKHVQMIHQIYDIEGVSDTHIKKIIKDYSRAQSEED